jgi:phenylalanine-4-hydroxylase
VAFGPGPLPPEGPFTLRLGGDVILTGVRAGAFSVEQLQGTQRDRPLDLPAKALLLMSAALPSVAGGPGDPEAWYRWFDGAAAGAGGGLAAEGEAESLARRRKAEALAPGLAALYTEVRAQRETGSLRPQRLEQILQELAQFPGDWLLRCEVQELMALAGA